MVGRNVGARLTAMRADRRDAGVHRRDRQKIDCPNDASTLAFGEDLHRGIVVRGHAALRRPNQPPAGLVDCVEAILTGSAPPRLPAWLSEGTG